MPLYHPPVPKMASEFLNGAAPRSTSQDGSDTVSNPFPSGNEGRERRRGHVIKRKFRGHLDGLVS